MLRVAALSGAVLSMALVTGIYPLVKGAFRRRMCGEIVRRMASIDTWPKSNVPFTAAFELTRGLFEDQGINEGELSARYLVSDAARVGPRRSDFLLASTKNKPLTEDEMNQLKSHAQKRLKKMPVQYILGNWDFYGLTLNCREPVLIPRPETEELVELLLNSKAIPDEGTVLDVGAGTGAVGLAILSEMPGVSCVALDVNPVAVELSMENAKEVLSDYSRYSCILKDFLEYAKDPSRKGTFDVIVSNPPYIPSDEMLDLSSEVSDYEDHRALHGGEDGMDLIRKIIELGPELLSDEGPGELWLEVARRHPDAIEEYVRRYNAELDHQNDKRKRFYFVEGINDLSNNPRFARLRLK